MFRKDEPGDTFTVKGSRVIAGTAAAQLVIDPEPAPEPQPPTLREMFYAAEPWNPVPEGTRLTPGMRRLQEKRVNRNLGIVADWLVNAADRHPNETVQAVLWERSQIARRQIIWPELEAYEATEALIREAKNLGGQ